MKMIAIKITVTKGILTTIAIRLVKRNVYNYSFKGMFFAVTNTFFTYTRSRSNWRTIAKNRKM
jgi:hypothetical protein